MMYTHNISYYKACLNCLKAENARFLNIVQTKDDRISTPSRSSKSEEFYLSQMIKVDLWNKREKCKFCGHEGCFDIWDIEVNSKKTYVELDQNTEHAQFYIQRTDEGNIKTDFRPFTPANLVTFLTFFKAAYRVIDNTPKAVFIEKDKGFVDIIVFSDEESLNTDINRFRHVGFSKSEIIGAIENIESHFKEEYDLS